MELTPETRGRHRLDGTRAIIGGIALVGLLGSAVAYASEAVSTEAGLTGMLASAIGLIQAVPPVSRLTGLER